MAHAPGTRDRRFDFEGKLADHPERVVAALAPGPGPSLSTVFFDLSAIGCNHDCIFCDGRFYEAPPARFTNGRLLELADEMAELGVESVLFVGENSEPLAHSGFAAVADRLLSRGVRLGIYTNGSILGNASIEVLRRFDFVRVSLDAATPETHARIHRPKCGNDFANALEFIRRLAAGGPREVGVSLVLLPDNVPEIAAAARLARSLGAHYLEVKPFYTAEYGFDFTAFESLLPELRSQLGECKALEDGRFSVIVNRQIDDVLASRIGPHEVTRTTAPRLCLTSKLRLVVSPRGCFLCPPYRGRLDKSLGDARAESLREIWDGARHRELLEEECNRRCVYHEQNERLLELRRGDGRFPERRDGAPQPGFL